MTPWTIVKHLFDFYDGFPDIKMENLSEREMLLVFDTLVSFCEPNHDPKVWSLERRKNALINEIIHPEREFGEGRFEYFSHQLTGLRVGGVELFDVDIWAEDDLLALDYKPGDDWDEYRVFALFKLLYQLQQQIPGVCFTYSYEGCSHSNPEFAKAFKVFCSETKN